MSSHGTFFYHIFLPGNRKNPSIFPKPGNDLFRQSKTMFLPNSFPDVNDNISPFYLSE